MIHRFFLSHSGDDKKIAEIIANILKRISLNQIAPWFSSDESGSGGLQTGIWFNAISDKLSESKAVVVILTPNSISRPWIYFEAGMGHSLDNCEIIPVCVGISRDKIYPPLGLYQCYQLCDYHSLKVFIEKLLSKFDITFDEEMSKSVLENTLSLIAEIQFDEVEENPKMREILDDLRSHIDKRFFEIWEKPSVQIVESNVQGAKINIETARSQVEEQTYSIPIEINFPNITRKHFIEIQSWTTFTDVTNKIYFLLQDHIEPFRYLETWILRDKKSGRLFVIREVANIIPARLLFRPEFDIEVIPLENPYNPELSRERVMELQ